MSVVPTDKPDHRLHAYRDDLADVRLEGQVKAARFVEGRAYRVVTELAPVHPRPSRDADLNTEALCGEAVTVFEVADGMAWCQLGGDNYVGYIPLHCLAVGAPVKATHKVATPQVLVYSNPDAASKPVQALLLGTRIRQVGESGGFLEIAGDGWSGFVSQRHVELLTAVAPDYAATAMMFMRTPYLWGGKSARGIDCSGLVQLSLLRAEMDCPRDTDMQARALPGDVEIDGKILDRLQRGDIVYWPGHVGIMIDDTNMIHASGTLAATGIEPVAAVAERSRKGGPVVHAVKRLML